MTKQTLPVAPVPIHESVLGQSPAATGEVITMKQILKERFWAKVDVRGPDDCWPWLGAAGPRGYGRFAIGDGAMTGPHRFSYELVCGPISDGMLICHHCDNPSCCNPAHLFVGTNTDNMQDAKAKGRLATGDKNGSRRHPELLPRGKMSFSASHPERLCRGSDHYLTHLDETAVEAMRVEYARGGISQRALARKHRISQATVWAILTGKSWKKLTITKATP